MYMVRKPESIRSPALQRSANTTSAGHPELRLAPASGSPAARPAWRRPRLGAGSTGSSRRRRRRTRSAATTASRTCEARPASGAEIGGADDAGERDPAVGLDQGEPLGCSRGTVAARATPYALEETSTPRAVGNIASDWVATASAISQHRKARSAIVLPIAHRRPWLNRSRNGPSRGATIANGSIVRPRKSATWPRASPGWAKNSVPASEMATAASPAALNACSSIRR